MSTVRILHRHCLDGLKELADESVHCCITSPPYWGLRAYKTKPQIWGGSVGCVHHFESTRPRHKGGPQGNGGQRTNRDTSAQDRAQHLESGDICRKCGAWRGEHGLEPTIDLYVKHEVEIFREVRRVLRSDGTLWLNLGDTYASNGGHTDTTCNNRRGAYNIGNRPDEVRNFRVRGYLAKSGPLKGGCSTWSSRDVSQSAPAGGSLKPKDLCMVPARVAIALQADGWFLRSDIIWQKPNPMPESVDDRPTKSHEYIFLLTKGPKYFYDAEAIKEPISPKTLTVHTTPRKGTGVESTGEKVNLWMENNGGRYHPAARNKRSVWTVATTPFKGAHFATFPHALVTPVILAGTSAKGCCAKCGAPLERIVKDGAPLEEWKKQCGADSNGEYHGKNRKNYRQHKAQPASTVKARILRGMREKKTVGWKPSCPCNAAETVPCVVLDPFGGSGTVGQVAADNGRDAILFELNQEYIGMAHERLGVFAPQVSAAQA